ncbi:hypothetical protein [Candidatus Brocadia sinica]|uniref:DNA uptake protein and related DNA-binding proteins n=1 Tax=Candidatus Brocadia sinica JPN1 TaxID=1197129 RepID=A0ABQ0JVW9_9BACT|nr:hypothetical protein [Candidatus Brocadia sinica]MBL1167262.1 hypothetical protein [Candidatus Brocadia sp. AMX1]NOG41264.1 hypothetical protein [Planctomycetota bacterium]GAN32900.1 DNA uptake protein and related DNA-binding proteins [Candidatus Brocadia sinica JPN1]GIK14520.1 MAG: hypothetical protein BroJett002_32270 [Candidatus Brocadia sinica]GJQ16207.1 MAG: hypothetical protein HBSIN01_01660 [Candidatus Brocadia sinica]
MKTCGTSENIPTLERERAQFRSLILQNPNYFGNLELSPYKPVKLLQGITTYEELMCVGLNPPSNRLEAALHVKQEFGYGGDICSPGSFEYVRFYVDIFDNGVWHDVGMDSVRVHNIPGEKPLCYAVRKDFTPFKRLCSTENIVRVRAILSWDTPPPANQPNWTPVYGNVMTVQVQIHPKYSFFVGDVPKGLENLQVKIPDPIGPIIAGLDPNIKVKAAPLATPTLSQRKALYADKGVPVHRFGFAEAQKLLAAKTTTSALVTANGDSPLASLGLNANEIADLFGKLQVVTDGDTSFEELKCIGLRSKRDLLEAVLTVKRPYGYSGGLCGKGSTEYVAFWIDFGDGSGFIYMGTATVQVHDLQTIPPEDVQYAVFLKKDFTQYLVPCEAGPKVVRLRAILSWETPPPPANPNYVPVWGNREECLIQLRHGKAEARTPVIETVGDISVDDIDPATGLATGDAEIGIFSVNLSPFGGGITITGRIAGTLPDSFGGGALPLKYRILVRKDDGIDTWHPLTNTVDVDVTKFVGAVQLEESPGDTIFNLNLTATDDADGLGEGWYEYLEDHTAPSTRFLLVDKLARWLTNASMEGEWEIRMEAKDPNVSPPTFYPGAQVIRVRVDNTAPSSVPAANIALQPYAPVTLTITGAEFNGNPVPAIDCGKFPVGTILTGTYEAHDPGTSDLVNQHFGSISLDVIPDGPAHGATVMLSGDGGITYTFATSRSFPTVPTTGESGHWRLDTAGMDPCGYVIHMVVCDRTNYGSHGIAFCVTADIGFCLEESPISQEV